MVMFTSQQRNVWLLTMNWPGLAKPAVVRAEVLQELLLAEEVLLSWAYLSHEVPS